MTDGVTGPLAVVKGAIFSWKTLRSLPFTGKEIRKQ